VTTCEKKLKVAINGFGRIGRNFLRCWNGRENSLLDVVAINDSGGVKQVPYLAPGGRLLLLQISAMPPAYRKLCWASMTALVKSRSQNEARAHGWLHTGVHLLAH